MGPINDRIFEKGKDFHLTVAHPTIAHPTMPFEEYTSKNNLEK